MPWFQVSPVDIRHAFVAEARARGMGGFSAVCRKYEISRKTGYKWLRRGLDDLGDRRPVPGSTPHQLPQQVVERILELREHAFGDIWGPKKIRQALIHEFPGRAPPALSTIQLHLHRHGLVRPGKKRRPRSPMGEAVSALTRPAGPNDVWCIDFKGDALLGNGERCYPLTITDLFSRMLLAIVALPSTAHDGVVPVFERTFRDYGLPKVIRSDNGTPFACASALGGLSRLSAWFIELGIWPERIEPGKPQQNGAHERMHGTIVRNKKLFPREDFVSQRRAFAEYLPYYNYERPHEGIGNALPGSLYKPSERRYLDGTPPPSYPRRAELRLVDHNGVIKWRSAPVFLTASLAGKTVALTTEDGNTWTISFGQLVLGKLADRTGVFTPATDLRPHQVG
jgi:transposase InsO family protein